jgi:hypothetical protein
LHREKTSPFQPQAQKDTCAAVSKATLGMTFFPKKQNPEITIYLRIPVDHSLNVITVLNYLTHSSSIYANFDSIHLLVFAPLSSDFLHYLNVNCV